ncbi:MAG: hypothetical protein U0V72_08420 [Cytophagales bacterium]
MFDKVSKFNLVNKLTAKESGFEFEREIYSFDTLSKQNRYIVYLDKYNYNLYVIKFYLKNHQLSEDKFNLLTSLNEVQNILATCLEIIILKKKQNPYASFAFLASRSENELDKETPKRFKVYSRLIKNMISPVDFEHFDNSPIGIYLLKNKLSDFDEVANTYLQMLIDVYTL